MIARRLLSSAALLTVGLLAGACEPELPTSSERLPGPLAPNFAKAVASSADLLEFPPPGGAVVGTSQIRRNSSGINVQINHDSLPRRHAFTIWAVIFNEPSACASSPCMLGDLMLASGDVVRVTGRVVAGGATNFQGRLRVGDASESIATGLGLTDPFGAEIHLIVRSHGSAIPGMVEEQIHTVGGGCEINVCDDLAFAIHQP